MELNTHNVILLLVLCPTCWSFEGPSVTTDFGVIKGETVKAKFKNSEHIVDRYIGIRYAQPPVGDKRFKKPEAPQGYNTSLKATEFGAPCPQVVDTYIMRSTNEDCLFLNVYVPKNEHNEFAVMIFIHGGGFSVGSADTYSPEVLTSHGNVIVVTINYRLGIFGFLNIGDDRAPGNQGLWDQRLALQWVKDNIAAFGGDNGRITIFGESAGAMSVLFHGLYPNNKGLFHNMIAQSGSPTSSFIKSSRERNMKTAKLHAELLNCSTNTTEQIYDCFMTKDVDVIYGAGKNILDPEIHMQLMPLPSVDGELIKRDIRDIIQGANDFKEGLAFLRTLKLINGVNSAEGVTAILGVPGIENGLEDITVSKDYLKSRIAKDAPHFLNQTYSLPEALLDLAAFEYMDWTSPTNVRKTFVKVMGDITFNVPAVEFSILHAEGTDSNSWLYSFDATVEQHLFPKPSWAEGANHEDETGPVFGYSCDDIFRIILNVTDYVPPDWELNLSERMMTYWTNFAKYGNPNGKSNEKEGAWPMYNLEGKKHIVFSEEDSIGEFLYEKEIQFWRQIMPNLLKTTVRAGHSAYSPDMQKSNAESCSADGTCG